ncbi:hypothetical protein HDV05_005970, partial [Chytridiales sp. JEL 0842]
MKTANATATSPDDIQTTTSKADKLLASYDITETEFILPVGMMQDFPHIFKVVTFVVWFAFTIFHHYQQWHSVSNAYAFDNNANTTSTFPKTSPIILAIHLVADIFFIVIFLILQGGQVFVKPKQTSLYLTHKNSPDALPMVDILIPTCGEPLDCLKDTIKACLILDYPPQKLRIWILDDAKSSNLKQWCEDTIYLLDFPKNTRRCLPQVLYRSRTKIPGVPHHFKGGNLNYGLSEILKCSVQPDFIAQFDADMVPSRSFLRSLLPHLLKDPKLGVAFVPQRFYNVPEPDWLLQDLEYFFSAMVQVADSFDAATYIGSGYIFRRQALTEGPTTGFGYQTMNEDFNTSIITLRKGWRTKYVHEDLQFGLIPDTLRGHMKQRSRWALGLLDTVKYHNFLIFCRDLEFQQKVPIIMAALGTVLCNFTEIFHILSLLLSPFTPLNASGPPQTFALGGFLTLLQTRALYVTLFLIHFLLSANSIGTIRTVRGYGHHISCVLYLAPTYLCFFFLPKMWGGGKSVYVPTGTASALLEDDEFERIKGKRRGLVGRLWGMVVGDGLWMNVVLVGCFVWGVWRRWVGLGCGQMALNGLLGLLIEGRKNEEVVLRRVGEFGMCLAKSLRGENLSSVWMAGLYSMPLIYMVFPSNMPERSTFVPREENTGAPLFDRNSLQRQREQQRRWQ